MSTSNISLGNPYGPTKIPSPLGNVSLFESVYTEATLRHTHIIQYMVPPDITVLEHHYNVSVLKRGYTDPYQG